MSSGSPPPTSSSSQSSRTPPPQVLGGKTSKSSKEKAKSKVSSQAGTGRNEGTDPTWNYAPPAGAVLINDDVDAGEFDWDTINNNDDLELWLIRVPDSVKAKHLEGIKIDIPSSSKSACIGTIQRKAITFDICSLADDENVQDKSQLVSGEEIKNLSCLLPRKGKKGKLYPSPKPISHRLVVTAQAVTPTPKISSADPEHPAQYKNPPRYSYPKEVLKHRFIPYGSLLNPVQDDSALMDIDDAVAEEPQPPPSPKKKHIKTTDTIMSNFPATEELKVVREVKSSKGKKRKGETAESPDVPAKKSKKTKV